MKSRQAVRWLAEFVVVVLGILGAFAVEDWGAWRTDRALERAYLGQLKHDLEADEAEMDENRLAALARGLTVGRVMAAAAFELEPMESPSWGVPLDLSDTLTIEACTNLTSLTACLTNYRTYDGSRASYDELVSTGNLRVIQNPQLTRALAVYYAQTVAEMDADQSIGRPDVQSLGRILNRHGFALTHGGAAEYPQASDLVGPVQRDAELRALLVQVRHGALWQITRIETVARPRLRAVLALVEDELARVSQ